MSGETLYFNGVNAETGGYALPPMTLNQLAARARGETISTEEAGGLRDWLRSEARRLRKGNAKDLAQAGWGVLFAQDDETVPAVREALKELLDHRRAQAGSVREHYYQELLGEKGYRRGDTKDGFLARFGIGVGDVDPDHMPYYLMIVGDPAMIPYEFQYQLDVPHAVGRIHFDTLDEYARYARSVVQAETAPAGGRGRKVRLFGPQHPDDPATELTANGLVAPLAEALAQDAPGWDVQKVLADGATKTQLASFLSGGAETPDLLFTAGHGLVLLNGNPRQPLHQGALLCQGWPGPKHWLEPLSRDHYFAGEDLDPAARLDGLITFHFACYSGGAPEFDDFSAPSVREQVRVAPHPFVARLPQRLLGAGALAVIGHVEHTWESSVELPGVGRRIDVFQDTIESLLSGAPVGAAMECFAERYAELATVLAGELQAIWRGRPVDDARLASLWTTANDARNFAVLGDPAVRLAAAQEKP
jgi:peptidase C25-like protein